MAELLGKKARAPKGYREGREKGRDKMGTKRATLISELISNNNDWACVCVCVCVRSRVSGATKSTDTV